MDASLQQRSQTIRKSGARLILGGMLGLLIALDASAGLFARVYASDDRQKLTEWGSKYEQGRGVPANMGRAVRLYCKAAKKGQALAQYRLGWIYANGRGVKRDDALAVAWFRMAARQNHVQSRNMLKLVHARAKKSPDCPVNTMARRMSVPHAAKPEVVRLVRDLAPEYGLDSELVLAVVEAESNYDPNALSPKNAQGLMQLIPETAKRFGVVDVWDPKQNLRGGMAYLRWLLKHFDGDLKLALAGYNAGEESVLQYGGIPPYSETQEYVRRIALMLDR
jgi:TPR repeat protein